VVALYIERRGRRSHIAPSSMFRARRIAAVLTVYLPLTRRTGISSVRWPRLAAAYAVVREIPRIVAAVIRLTV